MELYNKQFVYFDWDDKLEGKKGFVAQNIVSLKSQVYNNPKAMVTLSSSDDDTCPFTYYVDDEITCDYQFCYCDPYYEFRKAYIEGKQLQYKNRNGDWIDVDGIPLFTTDEYRIKPEIKWHVVLSDEGILGIVKSTTKHIYFTGDEEECAKWIDEHKGLIGTMKAWEEGKTIQYLCHDAWSNVANNIPSWGLNDTYRVKPDECKGCMKYNYCANKDGIRCKSYCTKVEYVPFDTVQELIDAWDSKYPQNKNRPEGTMPLIWIKNKVKNRVYLITDFLFDKYLKDDIGTEDSNLQLKELFEDYTFLDNSIIGKVKE